MAADVDLRSNLIRNSAINKKGEKTLRAFDLIEPTPNDVSLAEQKHPTMASSTSVVYHIFPRIGSINGGSRITIIGKGFSDDQFNFGPGREHLGNVVKLVSSTKSYDCDKHMDGNTPIQITCYTRPMEEDYYRIQLTIDGVTMNSSSYCPDNPGLCLFHRDFKFDVEYPDTVLILVFLQPTVDNTPTITSLSKLSGPPGQLITVYGRIMTRMYEANDLSKNATNGVLEKIERVYMGSMPCNMLKEDGSLYGLSLDEPLSKYGNMTCLITSKFIGAMRFTFLLEIYGRSNPDLSLLKLYPGDVIGMYEQYPEITVISPKEGSTEGYTYVTITGAGLDDATVHKPIVKVGGKSHNGRVNDLLPHNVSSFSILIICLYTTKP
ncbi:hypothetical protein LSH36_623g04076 [Paralvinella palmiformis]|uniref:IPT/TIG domain-containing protein n=1 Tax=Paralvinella palmiformis TaxID=53620 RepID=A0AAD9MUT1_9ANNE|nr:hypothetical protein LSH36_623g04076 [Paralvinella palmiformis]